MLCLTIFLSMLGNDIVYAQANKALLQAALQNEKIKQNLKDSDISEWKISSQQTDKSTGITHTYIQQLHNGIPVYNAISVFAVKQNNVVSFKPGLVRSVKEKANAAKATITPEAAFHAAAVHLELPAIASMKQKKSDVAANQYEFTANEVSAKPVKVQLLYVPVNGKLVLAWDVSIDLKDGKHWWNVRIDASTGSFIDKNDYVRECNFGDTHSSHEKLMAGSRSTFPGPLKAPAQLPPASSTYNVFPFPLEAPSFGSRSLLTDPADPTASPFGWHDTDGAAGAEYTITRGNNVYAYEDQDADNIPGYSPDGGAGLNFDFPLNTSQPPANSIDAAITNLFYVVNNVHDKLYTLGFDEASGNFAENNYGNGGTGNDPVLAEGLDGGGFNNANFATPPDGTNGRMQMFLWSGPDCSTLNITGTGFNGTMTVLKGGFSPIASATADIILMDDGVAPTSNGCETPVISLSGKIVLIDRGTCAFVNKVLAAQAGGAVGVIIANNTAGLFSMGGAGPVTIPAVMISQADGITLKNELLSGVVNATLVTCTSQDLDGSFDNGIIAHEFGHGVSNRLTGGPANSSCLFNGEQAGEGWSDWLALMMTIEPGDQGTDARDIGSYVFNGGIRRFPYSTDMNINPQTYADLAISPEVHDIGEIWCSAIWDMTWLLIDQYGYDNNPANAAAGNNIAIKLVLEGMKLQPCGPGFLDSRDAILLADKILYNDAHRCQIGQAFARRGMGSLANQGSADIAGDETADFSDHFCTPCAGKPDAGPASSTAAIVCALNEFTVKVPKADIDLGLTYQWQLSPDNTNWTNIGGATDIHFTGTQNSANSYRCIVTCANGGSSDTSSAVSIGFLTDCILMSNNTVTTCSGNLFDSGGPSGNYSDLEDYTQTFVPATGNKIKITWDYFSSEQDYDYITIFDGPDNTYPVLFGPASGTQNIPAFISSDPTGTLTVQFTSDEAVNAAGWEATVSCVSICTGPVNDGISNPVICQGGSTVLSVSGSSGYTWSPAAGLKQTTGSSVTASPATTTTYTVTSADNAICHIEITVTVNPLPAAAGTISGPVKVCKNKTGFVYTVGAISDATSYVWTLPAEMSPVTGGLTTATNSITVKTSSYFSSGLIKVYGVNSCGNGILSPAFAVSKLTSKPSTPTAINGIYEYGYGYCAGNTYTFTTTSNNADSYFWKASAGVIQSGQGTNTVTITLNNSNFSSTVSVTASNCVGTSEQRKITLKSVLPAPNISGTSSVCKNTGPVKTYSASSGGSASSFTWSSPSAGIKFSDGGIPANPLTTPNASVNVDFSSVSNGVYSIRATANNSCGSSSQSAKSITVKNCTKSEESIITDNGESKFTVFPNPTHDLVTVSFTAAVEGKYSVRLTDMIGNVVVREEKDAVEGNNEYTYNLEDLSPGVYSLTLQLGETTFQTRIIKQ